MRRIQEILAEEAKSKGFCRPIHPIPSNCCGYNARLDSTADRKRALRATIWQDYTPYGDPTMQLVIATIGAVSLTERIEKLGTAGMGRRKMICT